MKESVFNALPVYSTLSQVTTAGVGTYFFFGTLDSKGNVVAGSEAAQANNIALRHKITYHQRVAGDGSGAGQGSLIYRRVLDILESDTRAQQSKTTTRPGVDRDPARDDDDRLRYNETPFS